MILGIGNDMIEVERVEKACQKNTFLQRVYTDAEISLFQGKPQSLAGNFAGKEAVAKAFGTGFLAFSPKEIELLRDKNGKPYVNLYGNAKKMAETCHAGHIFVSLSNLKQFACAVAVIEAD